MHTQTLKYQAVIEKNQLSQSCSVTTTDWHSLYPKLSSLIENCFRMFFHMTNPVVHAILIPTPGGKIYFVTVCFHWSASAASNMPTSLPHFEFWKTGKTHQAFRAAVTWTVAAARKTRLVLPSKAITGGRYWLMWPIKFKLGSSVSWFKLISLKFL